MTLNVLLNQCSQVPSDDEWRRSRKRAVEMRFNDATKTLIEIIRRRSRGRGVFKWDDRRAAQRTLRREALPLRSSTICVLKKPLTSPRADTATTILRCNYRRPLITGRASRAGPRRVIIPIQCRTRTVRAVCMHSVSRDENVWKVYPRWQALMCQKYFWQIRASFYCFMYPLL